MSKIRLGILGYGNIGKGVEKAILQNPDMELIAIFTRRNIKEIKTFTKVKVVNVKDIMDFKDKIDVLILCGGSATDLPVQGPEMLRYFNTVDSYDTHSKIPDYYNTMNKSAIKGQKVGIISIGWDPGLFSLMRLIFNSVLPDSHTETFWGPGVSQGHSDAIRRIPGVSGAVQYTIPIDLAVEKAKEGKTDLTVREKHLRECYVAVEEGTDKKSVEEKIKNMPAYFADYDTLVHFVSLEELKSKHSKMPHGGIVLNHGITGESSNQVMKFQLELESNPEFTSSVLVAYARAAYRLAKEGKFGAATIFDIPLSYISLKNATTLQSQIL